MDCERERQQQRRDAHRQRARCGGEQQRERRQDSKPDRQLGGRHACADPEQLVGGGEQQAGQRERWPRPPPRHEQEPGVEQQQIAEQPDRLIGLRGNQERSREAADQGDRRDQARASSHRQRARQHGHSHHAEECWRRSQEAVARVRRPAHRVERDRARTGDRMRGPRVAAAQHRRRAEHAGDAGTRAQREPQRGRDETVLDRVLEQENAGEGQRHTAGDRGAAHAKPALPVDRRRRRRARGRRVTRARHVSRRVGFDRGRQRGRDSRGRVRRWFTRCFGLTKVRRRGAGRLWLCRLAPVQDALDGGQRRRWRRPRVLRAFTLTQVIEPPLEILQAPLVVRHDRQQQDHQKDEDELHCGAMVARSASGSVVRSWQRVSNERIAGTWLSLRPIAGPGRRSTVGSRASTQSMRELATLRHVTSRSPPTRGTAGGQPRCPRTALDPGEDPKCAFAQ